MLRRLIITLFFFMAYSSTQALELKSSQQQAVVIELFTSQGCSSCPPAEEYLNSFKQNEQLWSKFIPMAFHVDYWDYIGWKDRYAKPQHRTRQEKYAALNGQRTIYTPGFFVNGKPWRRSFWGSDPSANDKNMGVLKVNIQDKKLAAEYENEQDVERRLVLNVAILGMGFHDQIKAGENSGRDSDHDFVVLHHTSALSDNGKWQLDLSDVKVKSARQYAITAWVSRQQDPSALQAVGGFYSF